MDRRNVRVAAKPSACFCVQYVVEFDRRYAIKTVTARINHVATVSACFYEGPERERLAIGPHDALLDQWWGWLASIATLPFPKFYPATKVSQRLPNGGAPDGALHVAAC